MAFGRRAATATGGNARAQSLSRPLCGASPLKQRTKASSRFWQELLAFEQVDDLASDFASEDPLLPELRDQVDIARSRLITAAA